MDLKLALLAVSGAVAACGAEGKHLAQVFPTHVDGGSSQVVTDGLAPNSFVVIDQSTPTRQASTSPC